MKPQATKTKRAEKRKGPKQLKRRERGVREEGAWRMRRTEGQQKDACTSNGTSRLLVVVASQT